MAIKRLRCIAVGGYTYEERLNTCGKPTCKKCPHGPYWYRTITLRSGLKITDYLGKLTPEEIQSIPEDAEKAKKEWMRSVRGAFHS